MNHDFFMHRCLTLAEQGRGKVGNGALVGSVLVRSGTIIAEGHHPAYGGVHAERALLQSFHDPIQPTDILYVNLEPCCHHGKQPPCIDIILERGIKTVCFGLQDPDQRVAGKGLQVLREKGVQVMGPVAREACAYLNKGFVSVRTKARPWITTKMAYSRAETISKPDGTTLKITSQEQDVWSHTFLRARHDAILVGVDTINLDNPSLNNRFAQEKMNTKNEQYQPWRIIFDPHGRAKIESKIFHDPLQSRTIMITSPDSSSARLKNIKVFPISILQGGFDWKALWERLLAPDTASDFVGLTSILVEGGRKTAQAFKKAGFVDEDIVLVGKN